MNFTLEQIAHLIGGKLDGSKDIKVNTISSIEDAEEGSISFLSNPKYEQICSGNTGHAEAVKIKYDTNIISFSKLLEIFFKTHDPTTLNRQGNDVGTQYRSSIFYKNELELNIAKKMILKLNESKIFSNKIVTLLEQQSKFYEAEDYHKKYFYKNPTNMYCQLVVKPKIEKFLKENANI